jgi:hypothetical protein
MKVMVMDYSEEESEGALGRGDDSAERMARNRSHLRQLSRNYYGTSVGGGPNVAIGAAVPVGKQRFIFLVRVWHNNVFPSLVSLFRDGIAGAVPLDYFDLPGIGGVAGFEIGDTSLELALNIESPIYILESGEQLGLGFLAANNSHILVCGYDEP